MKIEAIPSFSGYSNVGRLMLQTNPVVWEGQADPAKLHGHPRTPVFHTGLQMHKLWATPYFLGYQRSYTHPNYRTAPLKPSKLLAAPHLPQQEHPITCLTFPLCPGHACKLCPAPKHIPAPGRLGDPKVSHSRRPKCPLPGQGPVPRSSQRPLCSPTPLALSSLHSG